MSDIRHGPRMDPFRLYRSERFLPPDEDMDVQAE